jgi:hypothetical protein
VVDLVALLEPAQDADRVLHARLADQHLLEPALQRGVLLDVLAVLVQRGRADHPQLAAGQHRLDHVARVHRALARGTGADDRVQLVDERDHFTGRVGDLLEHGLQPLLELAAELRARDHRPEVQCHDALAAQRLRHVTGDHALGEALDDRGLADAGLADQHRVVLGAPGQHLHDPADLRVAADHRVQLALAGAGRQVDAVLLQRLVGALRVRAGHPRRPAHLGERLAQRVRRGAVAAQQVGHLAAVLGETHQQVLGGDVLVAHLGREFLRLGEHPHGVARELRRGHGRTARGGQRTGQLVEFLVHDARIGADRGQQRRGQPVSLGQQRAEQVHRAHVRVPRHRRGLHRGRDRLLGLRGRVESVHSSPHRQMCAPAFRTRFHHAQRQQS